MTDLQIWAAQTARAARRYKQLQGRWKAQGYRQQHNAGQISPEAVGKAARELAQVATRAWREALRVEAARAALVPPADVIVDGVGESVLRFTLVPNSGAKAWVDEHVGTEAWQWLGEFVLGVEHRYAGNLIDALAGAGFSVQVR